MPKSHRLSKNPECDRLAEDARREQNWKRWGPYLAERQWGTVREDYSPDGESWGYFTHDQARSRAHRWGEDGLLGITDRECRLCFAIALWNGKDPVLKERLFGLTGPEGNHGEDVKECYFFLDATPTSSYLKALYKYPQSEFPYVEAAMIRRQAYAGLLWSKQFYHYIVEDWLQGDKLQPSPPAERREPRIFPRVGHRQNVTRIVGFGVPHDSHGGNPSRIRQSSVEFDFTRVVPAPQRANAGVRVELR